MTLVPFPTPPPAFQRRDQPHSANYQPYHAGAVAKQPAGTVVNQPAGAVASRLLPPTARARQSNHS